MKINSNDRCWKHTELLKSFQPSTLKTFISRVVRVLRNSETRSPWQDIVAEQAASKRPRLYTHKHTYIHRYIHSHPRLVSLAPTFPTPPLHSIPIFIGGGRNEKVGRHTEGIINIRRPFVRSSRCGVLEAGIHETLTLTLLGFHSCSCSWSYFSSRFSSIAAWIWICIWVYGWLLVWKEHTLTQPLPRYTLLYITAILYLE